MTSIKRREFLRAAAQAAGAAAALNVMPMGIRNALAIPAHNRHGSIEDVEHIVVLMQENRSFDHYFGTLRGVRGFGDTRTVTLPGGKPVWHQPIAANGGEVLPFHPDAPDLGLQFLQDLPHDWQTGLGAFNGGRYDQWVPYKGQTTMAYLTRDDIPFHYQLADAFTICDAYHCSINSSTDPNRYYMWTGYVGNDGTGGGPVLDNAEVGYSWSTYPEVLEAAGISWKVYQDIGTGLDAKGSWGWTADNPFIGNYGDTSLLYFTQYQTAQPGSPLYEKARTGTNANAGDGFFDILKRDVQNNTLPQVSWIVAPEAYSEHPNWPANYGAWYVDQVLQVLTSNPDVWSKTVLLINYDENDGFFDHIVPPFAPGSSADGLSTVDSSGEFFAGDAKFSPGPFGLGARVPMLIVSPWSKGGWVCSETFDHTSVIRLIARRFGRQHDLKEPNISAWRRAVCGDLTSAFNFANPNDALPVLPSTSGYVPAIKERQPDYKPTPPVSQNVPKQEPGVRPARALPYEFFVRTRAGDSGKLSVDFVNTGRAGAVFLLYRAVGTDAPRTYTVEAGKRLADQLALDADGTFDFTIHGPNGFLRRVAGKPAVKHWWSARDVALPEVVEGYDVANGNLQLRLKNLGSARCEFTVVNAYDPGTVITRQVAGGDTANAYLDIRQAYGWYDVQVTVDSDRTFNRRFAGHVETGRDSASDPALGA
jgi:phospholipase C